MAKIKKALGILPKGILTPSFIEIAPTVTKRALPTDDDDNDGRHVIAIAHQRGAKKPSINGYRDMVRKRNMGRQMKFQDGHIPGGQIRGEKTDLRIFTQNLP
jgi:hypothetical protein